MSIDIVVRPNLEVNMTYHNAANRRELWRTRGISEEIYRITNFSTLENHSANANSNVNLGEELINLPLSTVNRNINRDKAESVFLKTSNKTIGKNYCYECYEVETWHAIDF